MAFLNLKSRSDNGSDTTLTRLPSGSFTLDPAGRVVASTLPRSVSAQLVQLVSQSVMTTFESARDAQLTLTELVVDFPAFKVTARQLRGGAIIFLAPQALRQR
jgi:hypothetical protein